MAVLGPSGMPSSNLVQQLFALDGQLAAVAADDPELAAVLRHLGDGTAVLAAEELAAQCRLVAAALDRGPAWPGQPAVPSPGLARDLERLVELATRVRDAAMERGPASEEQRDYEQVRGIYLEHARKTLDELECLLRTGPAPPGAAAPATVTRMLDQLQRGCALLELAEPELLCRQALLAAAACSSSGGAWPDAVLLDVVGALRALLGDAAGVASPRADLGELLDRLRTAAAAAVRAGEASTVALDLAVGGEFAAGRDEFVATVSALLTTAAMAVRARRAAPADRRLLADAVRALHTVKGAAAVLGLLPIAALAGAVEQLLDGVRAGQLNLDASEAGLALAALDLLQRAVAAVAGGPAVARDEFWRLVGDVQAHRAPRLVRGAAGAATAAVDAMVVSAGGRRLLLPIAAIAAIERAADLPPCELASGRRCAELGADLVPVVDAAALLGEPPAATTAGGFAVVVEAGGQRVVLRVDDAHGREQVADCAAAYLPGMTAAVAGRAVLADGTAALLLRPEQLMKPLAG